MREHMLEGAARQASVETDLLRRGFEVANGTGLVSCDLIALKAGVCLRVEVRGKKKKPFPYGPVTNVLSGQKKHATWFDVLATVGNSIQYNRSAAYKPNAVCLELTGDHEQVHPKSTNKHRAALESYDHKI